MRRLLVLVPAVLLLTASPALARHQPPPAPSPAIYDVSYPQCGGSLPSNVTGGIVGVNDGIVLSANPCLPTEYAWATRASTYAPAFYANTANPGPAYSSHWPSGQQTPQICDGTNSTTCAYDYGWNAASDSFRDAARVTSSASQAGWWLDVETGNSWETLESAYGQTATARSNDLAALQGEIAALQSLGVTTVGVYSTSYQWTQITGGTGQLPSQPAWIAGVGALSTAQSNCAQPSFTSGRIALTQYAFNGYDADNHC
jgi:hypothetical protein